MRSQQNQLNRRIEEMLERDTPKDPTDNKDEEETVEISETLILKMNGGSKDLGSVQHIRLIGVRINELDKLDTLVPQLKHLNVSFCRVDKMEGFAKMKELREAILCHNQFQEIRSLNDCRSLIQLDLSHNRINEITGLNHLFKLEKLNLSGNRIALIENLDGLKNLTSLNLSSNRIKKIDFFPQLPCLSELDLSENLIEMIHPKLFENHKDIVELNLTKNRIRSLEFLNQLQNLEKLGCASNCLDKINLKVEFEQLEFLDFSGNEITEVSRFEEYFPNLFSLDVSKNSICIEDELGFIYEMESLCEFSFQDNPVCSEEFLVTFLRRHPQLDMVNGKVIHPAGHRFREEINQVQEEIIQLETQKEGVEDIIDDDNPTKQILKAHNITNLQSLLAQFKKEQEAEKLATQQFMSYYKHLNEEITIEEIRAESEKRRQRELLGEDYVEAAEEDANKEAQIKQEEEEEEDNDDDDEEEEEEEDHRYAGVVRPQQAQRGRSVQSSRSNILKHFDSFATLADENSLQGFMTELQNDFGSIRAKYQAIKGVKHLKRHNSLHNLNPVSNGSILLDDSDLENTSQNDILNTSSTSLSNRNSLLRTSDKNIIIKKMKQPILPNSLRGSVAVPSANSILSGSRGAVGLSNTLNLPMLPPRSNATLQKELKEFKKNLNDNEFLKRIGMGSSSGIAQLTETTIGRPSKAPAPGTGLATKKSFVERGGSLNKPRNFSATQQFSGQKVTTKLRDMENIDRDVKRDSISSLSNETQFQQTKGIIYSNKNSKARSKLIDPVQIPMSTKKL